MLAPEELALFRLDPALGVPFTSFSCEIACGLAAMLNIMALRFRKCTERLVDLVQKGDPVLRGMTRLRQCASCFQQVAHRLRGAWVPHQVLWAVPKYLRTSVMEQACLLWVFNNESGPLAVTLVN